MYNKKISFKLVLRKYICISAKWIILLCCMILMSFSFEITGNDPPTESQYWTASSWVNFRELLYTTSTSIEKSYLFAANMVLEPHYLGVGFDISSFIKNNVYLNIY